MRRRAFIRLLGAAALMQPFVVWAQQSQRSMPLVLALWLGEPSAPITVSLRDAFQQGLREDGYIEGENIAFEHRYYSEGISRG